jgi:hypothetical protein
MRNPCIRQLALLKLTYIDELTELDEDEHEKKLTRLSGVCISLFRGPERASLDVCMRLGKQRYGMLLCL